MDVPILSGIYADFNSEYRTIYPRNLIPVPKTQGISKGYLRPADGIKKLADGPGLCRGNINWQGVLYSVMGSKLCRVSSDGTVLQIGDVGNDFLPVSLDYSFDYLIIGSAGKLFYYGGNGLQQVTDFDLGIVRDCIWVSGYTMTTDGNNLVVTDLANPFAVNPLKYGSAEADPDKIVGLLKFRNEVFAIGRYSIEAFANTGGNLFPFTRINGAQIMRGAIGVKAFCIYSEAVAFIGGGRNEPCSIWLGINGQTTNISTREVDTILQEQGETALGLAQLEARVDRAHNLLYVHLSDRTLVYDANASQATGSRVWFVLTSGMSALGTYRARNLCWAYDKWVSGDTLLPFLGYYIQNASSHYSAPNEWEFATQIFYNETRGLIFHDMELVCLTGNTEFGLEPEIFTSYSTDGRTWSVERSRKVGRAGQRYKRIIWLQNGNMINWRIQKFRGSSSAQISIASLDIVVEPLYV